MEKFLFSFSQSTFDRMDVDYDPLESPEKDGMMKGKKDHMLGIDDWEEIESLFSEYGFYPENMAEKAARLSEDQQSSPRQQHQQSISIDCVLDDYHFSPVSPPIQPIQEGRKLENIQTGISDCSEAEKEKPNPCSLTSLGLLSNYGSGVKKLKGEKASNLSIETNTDGRRLSTEEIIKVAGARFIEFSTQKDVDFTRLMHPFGYALSDLSEEETDDIELAHHLLAAAEKVGYQQFDRASRLLTRCEWIASDTGNPVQRVVFYFAKALSERIGRETGRIASKGSEEKVKNELGLGLSCNLASLSRYQELPFTQVTHFTGMQAIIESIASANKVHVIDLGIKYGVHWTVLMQALTQRDECPIELLKITAVGKTGNMEIEKTGKRLESFAKLMNLNFSFKVVLVTEVEDLKEELFEIETDEVVAVYSQLVLRTMISKPLCLETLMRVLRNLNPSIMVVTEVEANLNSPSFVTRFTEALFFCSAFFDCLEACMDRDNKTRTMTEALLGEGIKNITSTEGEERITRDVTMEVWRAFFTRFGMVEIEFSRSSLYQANLLVENFSGGRSCTVDTNGKCVIVGWKGTPIQSLSAWKFSYDTENES